MSNHKYHADGSLPYDSAAVFVFGSNLSGIHGAGAAKAAEQRYGAKWGVGKGWQPTFRSYAIPTKDKRIESLSLEEIKYYVDEFVRLTKSVEHIWFVTRIGCGLAGYRDEQIAPMFKEARNCSFAEEWKPYLE